MKDINAKIKQFYPDFRKPTCELVGEDGNAFAIIARASKALKRAGYPDLVPFYQGEATAGDYDHLLQTTLAFVDQSDD